MADEDTIDSDNPIWTAEDFQNAKPTHELLGQAVELLLTKQTVEGERTPNLQAQIARQHSWLTKGSLAA